MQVKIPDNRPNSSQAPFIEGLNKNLQSLSKRVVKDLKLTEKK